MFEGPLRRWLKERQQPSALQPQESYPVFSVGGFFGQLNIRDGEALAFSIQYNGERLDLDRFFLGTSQEIAEATRIIERYINAPQ